MQKGGELAHFFFSPIEMIATGYRNYAKFFEEKSPVLTGVLVISRGLGGLDTVQLWIAMKKALICTLYEALTERTELMRCKYCHGPVQALKEYSTGARARIEHLQRHPGCRFPVGTFSGVESKHPVALK